MSKAPPDLEIYSPVSSPGVRVDAGGMMSLVEVSIDGANNIGEEAPEEWEEVELLVDSVASAIVIGEESVKAVSPSAPDPNKIYRLADGSLLHEGVWCVLSLRGMHREVPSS